jgi:hypothetical protein
MIKPEVLDALVAAGATAEMIAAAVKADRSSGAIRQERYRRNKSVTERNRASPCVTERNGDAKGAPEVSPNESINSNPLPTPSNPSLQELRSSREGAAARKTKIRSQISEDEQPVEADLEFARKAGMDSRRIDEEWAQFRDHHRKVGALFADWRAAWRTWVRNCGKFAPRLAFTNGHDPPAKPRTAADRRESMLGWWQENGLTRAQAEEKWEKMPSLHG